MKNPRASRLLLATDLRNLHRYQEEMNFKSVYDSIMYNIMMHNRI